MAKRNYTADEKRILKKALFWSSLLTWSSNQIIMMGRMMAMALREGLYTWYKDDPSKADERFTHHADTYYNCNFTTNTIITGIVLAMEKQMAEGKDVTPASIDSIKAALLGPLSGIGDSIYFNCLRVLVAGVAISLSEGGNILGPLFFLLVYGGVRWICMYYFLYLGYDSGTSFITKAFDSGIMTNLTNAASILGSIMVGALVASNVKVNLKWVPDLFGATVEMQGILDAILPGLLPICVFAAVTQALRKKANPITIIFVILGACIVLSFFGIL